MTQADRGSSPDDALGGLMQAGHALVDALDTGEVTGIERAVRDIARALAAIRAAGHRAPPEAAQAVRTALQLIDTAAVRTNFLADQAQRRLDALVRARGDAPRIGYARQMQGYA